MESNEFDGAFKRKAPNRAPRRRQADPDEDPESSVPTGAQAAGKKSGWGDSPGGAGSGGGDGDGEGGGGGRRQGRRRAVDDDEDDAQPEPTRHQIASIDDDDGEDTAFIPDLEDEEEDLGRQVAVAPSLKSSRVPTIQELEEEIDMALPSASEVGVDLSVLQAFLTPQEQCAEEDVPWDVDFELQMIASDMQKEIEAREGTVLPGSISPKRRGKKQEAADVA